ncbi:hypothetical protein EUA93_02175 [Nocardioides oleivorans]|uniref:WD40 repeat domain-containing protein n=1 Tax=Nocardioides oleivorans TaxID=273676 RepID=A0A4Q2RYY4_9ACTN|nr:hypothetical protein [Nocardioides oleivorans]RYB93265.1 hypothetical protein EUA93_02175 [Nocardioides oleivorans]
MVNDLRDLMREASSHAPHDDGDVSAVLGAGRRRVRVRRAATIGGTALAAGAITLGSMAWLDPSPPDLAAAGVPRPEGPVIGLGDARPAVEGTDYRVLTSYTNNDLDAANGQYLDGVTDDGLVLFRDGPHGRSNASRFALLDPVTGERTWLDGLPDPSAQFWPVELSADRIALLRLPTSGETDALVVDVYDRADERWTATSWPGLPGTGDAWGARSAPDGRLYVKVPATEGAIPDGGWPTAPDGEAEDADAEGDTYDLWSVSLDDTSDARDEGLRVGDVAFTDTSMVWTDRTNGDAGLVHVRDLASGSETTFDPRTGDRCNLLGFGASGDRIMMSQYCGTYEDGVRDDRVQVLSTDGDLVTTIQGSGIEGGPAGPGNELVTITSYDRAQGGTYVYDLADGSLLRLSDAVSSFGVGGPAPDGDFMWHTPVNRRNGATQWVGRLIG